ncbi:hypothetical protein [Amycolatopsis anabasis]|uniref:hypothetical protein n=1 Tax=Amycolatopsis anabasis TaxID=1840409 RepID=UPI00131E12F9|nr:hypothetical protein [Amycolatopsis anabasis]
MQMVSADEVRELFDQHIAFGDEAVRRAVQTPGGEELTVETNQAEYVVRVRPKFLRLGSEPWIRTLVVAERTDRPPAGAPETFVVAVQRDGQALPLYKKPVVATLGKRLHDGLDPVAYGEVLARYHPWTSAWVDVITVPRQLTREFGGTDLPAPPLPLLTASGEALRLTFHSREIHRTGSGGSRVLSIRSWEVRSWRDRPASWSSELVVRDALLDP